MVNSDTCPRSTTGTRRWEELSRGARLLGGLPPGDLMLALWRTRSRRGKPGGPPAPEAAAEPAPLAAEEARHFAALMAPRAGERAAMLVAPALSV